FEHADVGVADETGLDDPEALLTGGGGEPHFVADRQLAEASEHVAARHAGEVPGEYCVTSESRLDGLGEVADREAGNRPLAPGEADLLYPGIDADAGNEDAIRGAGDRDRGNLVIV